MTTGHWNSKLMGNLMIIKYLMHFWFHWIHTHTQKKKKNRFSFRHILGNKYANTDIPVIHQYLPTNYRTSCKPRHVCSEVDCLASASTFYNKFTLSTSAWPPGFPPELRVNCLYIGQNTLIPVNPFFFMNAKITTFSKALRSRPTQAN